MLTRGAQVQVDGSGEAEGRKERMMVTSKSLETSLLHPAMLLTFLSAPPVGVPNPKDSLHKAGKGIPSSKQMMLEEGGYG